MKKNIYLTLDTETVGGASNPTGTYHVGGFVHDRKGNILGGFNLLIMEHYDEIKNDDYAKKNFHIYEEGLKNGTFTVVDTEEHALKIISSICDYFGVKYVMAYNTGFDYVKTFCKALIEDREFIDIYLMTLQTIAHKKSYARFCRENGFKSRSGKTCATTAESVYAYLTDNADYKEEHTALEDSKIEMEIFLACLKMHKKYTKNVHQWDCRDGKCFPKWAE